MQQRLSFYKLYKSLKLDFLNSIPTGQRLLVYLMGYSFNKKIQLYTYVGKVLLFSKKGLNYKVILYQTVFNYGFKVFLNINRLNILRLKII